MGAPEGDSLRLVVHIAFSHWKSSGCNHFAIQELETHDKPSSFSQRVL